MEDLIKICVERDLDKIIKYFNQNKYPKKASVEGSLILEPVILNNDEEILHILLKNKVVFDEDILNIVPYTNQNIFNELYKYIINNRDILNLDLSKKPEFLIDLCKSYSSTPDMFKLALDSGYFNVEYKDSSSRKVIHCIACFRKSGFLKNLVDYDINYSEKDDYGKDFFDYAFTKYDKMLYEIFLCNPILKEMFNKMYSKKAADMMFNSTKI